jgi:tetratricopeptide (TPR) repeat protein
MEEEGGIAKYIIFAVKCFVWYPFVLPYRAIRYFLDRRPTTPPIIPVKSRPATQAETKAAETQLQLAHKFLMRAWDDRDYTDNAMRSLSLASKASNEARSLDPGAVVVVDQHGAKTSYTVDEMASHILFSQGELLVYGSMLLAEKLNTDLSMDALKDASAKISRYGREAQKAAETAIRYQPQNMKYRLLLAKVYRSQSKKREARKVIEEVLQAHPHNMDALELKAELG